MQWKEVATTITKLAVEQAWLSKDGEAVSYNRDQVSELLPHFPRGGELALYIWGSNSRAESARAAKLGWVPKGPRFWDQLKRDVAEVIKSLDV